MNSYAGLRTIQLAKEGEKKIILLNGKSLDFQVVTIPCLNLFNIHLLLLLLYSCYIIEFGIFGMHKLCDKQVGPLDQGYWPDGLLTPPSEEAIRHSRFFPLLKHPN